MKLLAAACFVNQQWPNLARKQINLFAKMTNFFAKPKIILIILSVKMFSAAEELNQFPV